MIMIQMPLGRQIWPWTLRFHLRMLQDPEMGKPHKQLTRQETGSSSLAFVPP